MEVSRKRDQRKRKANDSSNDDELQQHVLDRLKAYGDRLLGEDEEQCEEARILAAGNKETKEQVTAGDERTALLNGGGEKLNASEIVEIFDGKTKEDGRKKTKRKKKKWEEELEVELRGFSRDSEVKREGKEREKEKRRGEPEVIVFEDKAKRKKVSKDQSGSSDTSAMISTREHMREMAQEVYHLGLSGFDFEDKEKLEMQRAVKLGAKPPKNQYLPYKEFMEQQKQKKEEELKQREIDRKMGLQVKKKSNDKDDRKSFLLRKKGFWQDPSNNRRFKVDGQLGRYKNGVQVLSKRDVFSTLKGKGSNSGRGRNTKNKKRRR